MLPSHVRGIWPRDVLKKVSRGLSRVGVGMHVVCGQRQRQSVTARQRTTQCVCVCVCVCVVWGEGVCVGGAGCLWAACVCGGGMRVCTPCGGGGGGVCMGGGGRRVV